jgi:hypothetical protein
MRKLGSGETVIYLKSLGMGALATVLYLGAAVIAIWFSIWVETTADLWGVKTTTIRASVHNVPVYLFLAVAPLIFAIGFYWEFRSLAARQRAH